MCRLPGAVEPPENSNHNDGKDEHAEDAERLGPAEEMYLAAAEELLLEIAQPDIAELQPVTGEADPAEREDHRIDGRENGENQNKADGRRNEESASMAVDPLAPPVSG